MEFPIQQNYSKNSNKITEITCKYTYSKNELESMRFVNTNSQKLKWKDVYQTLESNVAKEYDELRVPDSKKQKKKKAAKTKEVSNVKLNPMSENGNGDWTKKMDSRSICDNDGLCYSRSEMEALRFVNVEEQQRKWNDLYHKLSSDILKDFDGLWDTTNRTQKPLQNTKFKGKRNYPSKHLGEVLNASLTKDEDVINFKAPFDEYDDVNDGNNSSSDEYGSIQRPAFYVDGEPDFESGPPEDGLEYLRRVRWEARQIPKVKVVKLSSSKLITEQTPYMPNIPDIPTYPPNLLPSKDWESAFLAEFSKLRQEILILENSCDEVKVCSKQIDSIQQLKKNSPTLTAILNMDAICRATTLKNYISSLENISTLSRDDCLWLFALCAAVDTPLHADTCASLRSLLRKCSYLLALKSECDDEVAMLTVIVTIAGKFFGQLENFQWIN